VRLLPTGTVKPIVFDLPELAALMSSLAVLGPTVSESAASAMRKLAEALNFAKSPAETSPLSQVPARPRQQSRPLALPSPRRGWPTAKPMRKRLRAGRG